MQLIPHVVLSKDNDETLPNFIKRKHPRKGEKKKQRGKHQIMINMKTCIIY
jgi:hypothetical protein